MSHALYRLGRLAVRRPWAVIGSWLVVSLLVVGASSAFGEKLEDSMGAPGLDSQKATDLLTGAGSDRAGLTAQVVVTPRDDGATFFDSAEARAALAQVQAAVWPCPACSRPAIRECPGRRARVGRRQRPDLGRRPGCPDPGPVPGARGARSGRPGEPQGARRRLNAGSVLQVELGGDLFFAFEAPGTGGEVIGLVVAVLILLIAFGSVIAMGLPIGMALFGLALGISSMSLITYLIDIPSWAPVVGSMVGLGVGIDYALFLVTRHREYLARGMTVEESVGRAVATAGQSVVFAGGTVVIAILGLAVAGVPFMTAGRHRHLGHRADHGGLLGHLAAGVPRPRGASDQRPRTPTQPAPRRRRRGSGLAALGWTRHPARRGVRRRGHRRADGTGRAGAGAPDRHAGRGALPPHRTERRAYDLVADGFGPGINGPLVVAVDISKDPSVVEPLASAIRADPGVASVAPPEVDRDAGVATLVAFPTTGPQDSATLDTVERLRTDVIPSVLGHRPGPRPHRRSDGELRRRGRQGQQPASRCSSAP